MNQFTLFIFGMAIGSFLNVVSLRYDPDKFILGSHLLGRSACPNCRATLKWFELIPVLSFLLQLGRCRRCGARLSFQYPLGEIASGLIFVFVPLRLENFYIFSDKFGQLLPHPLSFLWIFVFLLLLLVFIIDLRLKLIPNEINAALFAIGCAITAIYFFSPLEANPSFIAPYSYVFGFQDGLFLNRTTAALSATALFGFLIFATGGRGMGMGDLKLAIPLAVIFGWPDAPIIFGLSFIIGSLVSLPLILFKRKTMKSHIPFGPLIVLASATTFFFGGEIARFYFNLPNLFL